MYREQSRLPNKDGNTINLVDQDPMKWMEDILMWDPCLIRDQQKENTELNIMCVAWHIDTSSGSAADTFIVSTNFFRSDSN